MDTYQRHEFTKEQLKPAPLELVDPMAVYREMLETLPDVPDAYSLMKIDEIERRLRVEEREEDRPVEPEPAYDQNLKNQKF